MSHVKHSSTVSVLNPAFLPAGPSGPSQAGPSTRSMTRSNEPDSFNSNSKETQTEDRVTAQGEPYNILSLDGGGSRGVMEAVILKDVMAALTLVEDLVDFTTEDKDAGKV